MDAIPIREAPVIGYSMGGRAALHLAPNAPQHILVSTHPGLACAKARQKRQEADAAWIRLLETRPLEEFLEQWYAQTLFDALRERRGVFAAMLKRRRQEDPAVLIQQLKTYGLGVLSPPVPPSTFFLCGEKDLRYAALYASLPYSYRVVAACGHAVHLENPQGCAYALLSCLSP
jgi:2-succinyl-6-hydroxy-2,4-cyclohexadiene-1-carboxylate synthase